MNENVGKEMAVARYRVSLIGCALSGRPPEELPEGCSWEDVFLWAQKNSVLSLVWHAARELDGIPDDTFEYNERFSSLVALHNVRYEAERKVVCAALRNGGLSVLALKGSNLVSLYPDYSMREVGDNDILYGAVWRDAHGPYRSRDAGVWNIDSPNRELVLRTMRGLGYSRSSEGYECHLRFRKEPGLCFELHSSLFEKGLPMWRYYQNPWLRARALSEGSGPSLGHAFLFPPEDEYVYCLAHTFKHSLLGGYGLRALAG